MQTGTGGGGGGGGGGFPYRSPHQGGGYQPGHHKKSRKGKLWGMVIELDVADADRGALIGPRGSVVKQLQVATAAKIAIPKARTAGPVVLSADSAESVLHACMLVAQSGRICESGPIVGRMRPPQGMPAFAGQVHRVSPENPLLFQQDKTDGMRVLHVACSVHEENFNSIVDDAKFSAASYAEVLVVSKDSVFVFGQLQDKVEELCAALQAALPPTTPVP